MCSAVLLDASAVGRSCFFREASKKAFIKKKNLKSYQEAWSENARGSALTRILSTFYGKKAQTYIIEFKMSGRKAINLDSSI
jgi:hypothetical protein